MDSVSLNSLQDKFFKETGSEVICKEKEKSLIRKVKYTADRSQILDDMLKDTFTLQMAISISVNFLIDKLLGLSNFIKMVYSLIKGFC
jgi:hypothetical protein